MVSHRMTFREEKDTMGTVLVPESAYYGPQTQRAADNFPISGLRFQTVFIQALALLKKCAAQVIPDGPIRCNMNCRRDQIVARLALVYMIIGMNRRFSVLISSKQLIGAGGNQLVHVHIGGRPGTCLENIDHELVIKAAFDDFPGRRDDGARRRLFKLSEFQVHLGGAFLEQCKCLDKYRLKPRVILF